MNPLVDGFGMGGGGSACLRMKVCPSTDPQLKTSTFYNYDKDTFTSHLTDTLNVSVQVEGKGLRTLNAS